MFGFRRRTLILGSLSLVIATLAFSALRSLHVFQHKLEYAMNLRVPAAEPTGDHPRPASCANLYRSFCTKKTLTRDPTGSVRRDVDGELQALRIYEQIIHEHPDWSSDQVDEELAQRIYTPKRRQRIQGIYDYVVRAIERFVDKQPRTVFTSREKKQIKTLIKSTKLQLPPPAATYNDEPDLLTKNDVYFERLVDGTRRLRVGGAFLFTVTSTFNMIFTLAHELGHSIDPCEIRNENLSFPAYDRLTACFLENKLVLSVKTRTECVNDDQLSETFADWLAVQVTSEALKKYSTEFDPMQTVAAVVNTVRDICEEDDGLTDVDVSMHPSPEVRIQGIFGSNPVVRELLNCDPMDPAPPQCTFDWRAE